MSVQITNYQNLADKQRRGYQAISLDSLTTTAAVTIKSGSVVEVAGALYEFQADETESGGTWAGIGNSNVVYIYIVPAGSTATWIYSTTAPTWDTAKQSFYTGGTSRCVAVLYKDSGGLYKNKVVLQPWMQGAFQQSPVHGMQVFTSGINATWPCPGTGFYKITVVGGGGGGGGTATVTLQSGGSGGGGGTAISVLYEAAGTIFTYTVGASGGGASAGSNPGTGGGNSTLTDGVVTLTANGGVAGIAGAPIVPGSLGGTATGGQVNIAGTPGGPGFQIQTTAFPILQGGWSGNGGNSIFGGGAVGLVATTAGGGAAGANATSYGGGGSGASSNNKSGNQTGGNGFAGIIIIEY